MTHGKKYRTGIKNLKVGERYPLAKAVELMKQCAYAKFDETVELSMTLNLKAQHSVRDTMVLPHQFGKEKKIFVFAKGDKADEAKKYGAAFVGDDDLIEKIKGGWLEFDIAVSTPDLMKDVGKLGQILGRRGLMPNPKTQTVTFDIKGALEELRKGRVEFRADKTGVVHLAVGKLSMQNDNLAQNIQAVVDTIKRKRPADLKGDFLKSVTISSTMGPGIRLDEKEKTES
jgi:large subunit ribosomal protein L1